MTGRRPTGSVLVTGAGRGVGRACVERFLGSGWRVAAGVRDVERAHAELPDDERLLIVRLDVSVAAEVRSGVAAAEAHAGGALACLVSNAGYAVMGAQEDADLDEVRRMFDTNLFGAAAVTQAVLPGMRRAGGGHVIHVSSVGAWLVNPLVGYYHATKYGLTALAEALAVEGRPHGLRVTLVEPGMVDTDFPRATRVTGSLTRPDGPYAGLLAGLRGGFAAWRAMDGSTPESVAETIVAVAESPDPPFRVRTGADAELLAELRASAGNDEGWHDELRRFLKLVW